MRTILFLSSVLFANRLRNFVVYAAFMSLFAFIGCGGGSSGSSHLSGNASNAQASSASSNTSSATSTEFGLDTNPVNNTCLAPAPVNSGAAVINWQPAFPNLPAIARPSTLFQLPDDNTHWYVLRQPGIILRFANQASANSLSEALNIADKVQSSGNETGLLGAAIHPQFATHRYVFLYYTIPSSRGAQATQISRFTVNSDGTFDRSSELVILNIDRPYSNHVGGQMAFDAKGYLYIASGDGGSGGDPHANGQNLNTLLGKILRIDIDHITATSNYSIPNDNPFINTPNTRAEIWAYGLRNPWRFSFDKVTDELWAGDVGQDAIEEIDLINAGGNYGWGDMEGNSCYSGRPNCSTTNKIRPLHTTTHNDGNCSIIGGYVYRGALYPAAYGMYFFTDYCRNNMQSLTRTNGNTLELNSLGAGPSATVSFAQDNQGELFAIGQGNSGQQIYKMQAAGKATEPGTMAATLSQTGCVNSFNPKQAASGLIPYSVQSSLWIDGASKERYLALPANTQITLASNGDFSLPVGTVLLKHFKLGERFVETRLFTQGALGWQGFSYEWRDDQSDADLLIDGKDKTIGAINWHFPSRGQCLNCHTAAAGFSLGLETLQLNGDLTYSTTGRTANQLLSLEHIGIFTNAPGNTQKTEKLYALNDTAATLSQRARSYLHANCSGCHQPGGPTTVSLDLRYTTTLNKTFACNQVPVAGDLGISNAQIIATGEPLRSTLLKRMQITGNFQMPPLGRTSIDTEATQVIGDWISSLSSCD